jgi:hypothetical protein
VKKRREKEKGKHNGESYDARPESSTPPDGISEKQRVAESLKQFITG